MPPLFRTNAPQTYVHHIYREARSKQVLSAVAGFTEQLAARALTLARSVQGANPVVVPEIAEQALSSATGLCSRLGIVCLAQGSV